MESLARTRRQYPKYLTEIHALASSVCLHLLPLGQPLQGGTFVSGPASEVEHHTGVHSEKLRSEADHQSFEYVPLAIGLRLTKQRDHPFVRSQAQCALFPASFLPTVVLPDPGRPTSKIIVATYRFLAHMAIESKSI